MASEIELLCDLVLAPIFGFIVAKIVARLPAKVQLFLGSLVIASIAAPITWILLVSTIKINFGEALVGIPVLFMVILVLTVFSINRFQNRRKKHLTQDQFRLASSFIRSYQFQRALDILAAINDPLAREWEAIVMDMIRNDPEFLQHLESI